MAAPSILVTNLALKRTLSIAWSSALWRRPACGSRFNFGRVFRAGFWSGKWNSVLRGYTRGRCVSHTHIELRSSQPEPFVVAVQISVLGEAIPRCVVRLDREMLGQLFRASCDTPPQPPPDGMMSAA